MNFQPPIPELASFGELSREQLEKIESELAKRAFFSEIFAENDVEEGDTYENDNRLFD